MTKERIENRIKELEEKLFMVDMIDRWTRKDEAEHDRLVREIVNLKKELFLTV